METVVSIPLLWFVVMGIVFGILYGIRQIFPGYISKTIAKVGEIKLFWPRILILIVSLASLCIWLTSKFSEDQNLAFILTVVAFIVGYCIFQLGLWLFWRMMFWFIRERKR